MTRPELILMAINRRNAARVHDRMADKAADAADAIEHRKAAAIYRRQADIYDARVEGP